MSTNPSAISTETPETSKRHASRINPESLVRGALDDIALIVGGAAALHQLDDDLVWTMIKRLDRIRVRLLRDLRGLTSRDKVEPGRARPPRVHAAVEEFLVRNRAGMGE
jgi:hypothetical protein